MAPSSSTTPIGTASFLPRTVVDERIDVCAQFALLRMLGSEDPAARADAAGMLAAVKAGELHAVLNHTTFAAVRLARRRGLTRFDLVPPGEDAALVLEPVSPLTGPPSIVFRGIEGEKPPCPSRERLDPALRKAFASFRLWRARRVELCPAGGATQAEFATSPRLLANVTPRIFCQVRSRPSAPVVIAGKPLIVDLKGSSDDVSAGTLNIGVFQVPVAEITMITESMTIRFPRVGRWQIGFVQTVVVHRGRLDYGRGIASWFVGTPMLDQPDDRTELWMNPPETNPAIANVKSPGQEITVHFAAADLVSIPIHNSLLHCGVLRNGLVSVFFRAGVVAKLGSELHVLGATKGRPYGFHLTIEPEGKNGTLGIQRYRFTRTLDVDTSPGARRLAVPAPTPHELELRGPIANPLTRAAVAAARNRANRDCFRASKR